MTTLSTAYAILHDQLTTDVNAASWPSPEAGFLDYLYTTTGTSIPATRTLVTDRLDETPILATAGYQYAIPNFVRPPAYDTEWARHFKRLAQRQAFPIDRESYFYRPLDILDLCLGAKGSPAITPADRTWLQDVLRQGANRFPEHSRAHYLGAIAAWQLDIIWTTHSAPRLDELSLSSLRLLYWITTQPPLATSIGIRTAPEELAVAILQHAFATEQQCDDLADAGLILNAAGSIVERTIKARVEETWQAPRNTDAAVALVRMICERFTIVVNTLAQRVSPESDVLVGRF